MSERFDVIVVGGGSSGCALAGRLAEDPSRRVLLLEAGETAEANPETLRSDGYKDAFRNDRVIQERYTAPQRHVGGRSIFAGTGRGMGGSGAVNGMVYTRGSREDFDAWPAGWRWDDVVPAFEAVEAVLRPEPRPPTRWTEAVLTGAREAGFAACEDLNAGSLSGVMGYEAMNQEGAFRRNSYVGFVKEPARPNLEVRTGGRVQRVVFEGRRAIGVAVDGRVIAADRVVLAAGALETPKLLMLSGVGPGAHLQEHGVAVVHDLPGVGSNLHDHPNVPVFFLGDEAVDATNPQVYGFHRVNEALPLAPGQSDTCYVPWPAVGALAEAMERMVPAIVLPAGLRKRSGPKGMIRGMVRGAFTLGATRRFVARVWGVVVILGKPCSRGTLRLASSDVRDDAIIDPAYLTDPRDRETLRRGVTLARRIADATPWGHREISPGPLDRGEAWLDRWIDQNLMTTYHFAGTCRMGDDADSVVDTTLKVRGVDGLWVADASVIPETPVSALNAPSMMIGWRAAAWVG